MRHTVTVLLAMFGASSAAAAGRKHPTRRVQEATPGVETAYCNSLGCPGGYIPIPDASETECTYGICTVAQCCDAFCWGFACTNGIPNYENINDLCPPEGCSADLCCTIPVITCNSIGCPSGYIPIPDAANTPCDDEECTVGQCCDAFCWGIACPEGYVPNPATVNDECPATGCTTELCCTLG